MRPRLVNRFLVLVLAPLTLALACAPAAAPAPTAAPAKPAATAPAATAPAATAPAATAPAAAAKPAATAPAAAAGATSAAPAKLTSPPVVLNGITAWPKDDVFNDGFFEFARRIEQNSGGNIKVNYRGGPEITPPFEQGGAVKNGVFDIANSSGSYYTQLVPEAVLDSVIDGPLPQLRANGIWDLFDQVHQEKGGLKLLGWSSGSLSTGIYTRKPIKSIEDFKGMKIRGVPTFLPLIEGLGASSVTLAGNEIYSGMERGVVDAFAWPRVVVEKNKFHEVSCCIVEPGFFTTHEAVIMNLDTWKRLTPEQQKVMIDTQMDVEAWADAHFKQMMWDEMDDLVKKDGMQVIRLPEADAMKLRQVGYDGAWNKFLPQMSEWGPKIKEKAGSLSRAWPPQDYQLLRP